MIQKNENRRKSMLGTVLFALGIVAAVISVVTGSAWIAGAGAALLIPGAVMLYQVGKSLR